jgi:DNA mismatch endonuclease (patch repair protein)
MDSMADVFSKVMRSRVMSAIRSVGNASTEVRLMTLMRAHRISGWRRGSRLPGKPDFVFPGKRVAVFVDGCFWHGCPRCSRGVATNGLFWRTKISGNRRRDRRVSRRLRSLGWRVLRVWEHEIRAKSSVIPPRLVRAVAGTGARKRRRAAAGKR